MESTVFPVMSLQVFSPEEFEAAVHGAELKPCQLSSKPAPSRIARVIGPRTCLDFAEIGTAMWFSGVMPEDCYTLMFVTKCPKPGHSFNFGLDHTDGYMGIFPPGAELDAQTPEGYANASLTVPTDVFHAAVERFVPEIPDAILIQGAGMRIRRFEQTQLRVLLAAVMEEIQDPGNPLASLAARRELERMLLEVFLDALRSGIRNLVPRPTRRWTWKLKHLRQAREFVAAASHQPISLADVCDALGMSQRGVEALFQTSLGIGPNAFIRYQRLHGVRRALLESEPRTGVVKELALDWGFWHMGHFSTSYRTLFGESPTSTLMRPAN
jgi:AraC-like DNA-binding protein